ncbi:ribosome-binding factor A [Actinomyces sp. oral taxon 414]|nr:ribosome-binding factor A [Actinomyces sp. oral taxon 414]
MADAARARKVADRIHETVARLLQGRIKDPRLGFVTITDVRVTGDLQQATVFYTVYGTDKDRRNSAAALKSATGLIRSEVGRALGIRLTPSIAFQLDALPDQAKTFEDALARARARDEEIARTYAGAAPAGDADPYRRTDEGGAGGIEGGDGDEDYEDESDADDSEGEFGDEGPDDDSAGEGPDDDGPDDDGRAGASAGSADEPDEEDDFDPEVIA